MEEIAPSWLFQVDQDLQPEEAYSSWNDFSFPYRKS